MIKALSLAAALAVLPLSAALAEPQDPSSSEAAIESAASTFEARMEEFGARAQALSEHEGLTPDEREGRMSALWTEYAPDVQAFTSVMAEHAAAIAGQALAEVDIEALVTHALAEVDLSGAMAGAGGMAMNGAWASSDPEHMATYGLMADYALGEALDGVDEAVADINQALAEGPAAPAVAVAD